MKGDSDQTDASGWLAAQFDGSDPDAVNGHEASRGAGADGGGHGARRARRHGESAAVEPEPTRAAADGRGSVPATDGGARGAPGAPIPPGVTGAQGSGGFRWGLNPDPAAPPVTRPAAPPVAPATVWPPAPPVAPPVVPAVAPPVVPAIASRRVVADPFLPDDPALPEPILSPGPLQPAEPVLHSGGRRAGSMPPDFAAPAVAAAPTGAASLAAAVSPTATGILAGALPTVGSLLPTQRLSPPDRVLPTELFSAVQPGEPTVPLVARRTFRPAATASSPTELLPAGVAERDADDSPLAALFRERHHGAEPATAAFNTPQPTVPPLPSEPVSPRRVSDTGSGRSKNRRLLFWAGGAAIAVLVLMALFFLGTKLPELFGAAPAAAPAAALPAPVASPVASASPSPSAVPATSVASVGPHAPGPATWEQLSGGECLAAYTSPWVEDFTVVDCAKAHPAQMVHRGVFGPDDGAATAYPGVKALQAKAAPLCSAPTVIDLAAAGKYSDIQVATSVPATKAEWVAGLRDYWCFVNRKSGEDLTGSIVVPVG